MECKNTLYLECYSGISGDMTVAALLDLGATEEHLRKTLEKLHLGGYEVQVGHVYKKGLYACDFDVKLEHHHAHSEAHDSHAFQGEHDSHTHHGEHEHRTWRDIEQLLEQASLKPEVLELAKKMFRIVAEAEGKVHGRPAEEVHFHEVGAIDSIVDIVAVAACLDELNIGRILVSDIWEGQGQVHCQHGLLPVPVPAVLQIAKDQGLHLKQTSEQGEMVTPTGAAIAALGEQRTPVKFTVKGIGLGAGKKEFSRANVLRAMLIEEEPEGDLWLLESCIDDCSGEILGYTMELLLEAGANDVFFTPVYMKKNRPAYKISLLCQGEKIREMDEILFRETTTIGVRRYKVEREILERHLEYVETPCGKARVKCCSLEGESYRYPEYEDVKTLAKKQGISYKEMYRVVQEYL